MKSSKKIVEDYINNDDWRTKENSNCTRSVGALGKYMISEVSKDYWLREVYNPTNPRIAEAYLDGFMHIHDLNCLSLYCCGFSLPDIIKKGVKGVSNIPTSTPAHHFMSIINQVSNLTTIFQNEIAGAVAFSSVDTLLAPFIKAEGLSYEQVKQFVQNWIFSINSNSRAGAEPAFSNATFDLFPPEDLIDKECVIDGVPQGFTYRDCQPEMDMFNRAFFELMIAGDAAGNPFAYPIPTYNIAEGFNWDNPNNELLWEMAGKYGTPYFANYMGSDMSPSDARSMCVTPDTTVQIRVNGKKIVCSIKEMFDTYDVNSIEILTRYGYKPIQEKMCFHYTGDMYKFTTESGKVLITTPDHPHLVYDRTKNNFKALIKMPASDVQVGDYFSLQPECSFNNINSQRKGKSYTEIYGEDKTASIKEKLSAANKERGAWVGENNPSYGGLSQMQRVNIGLGLRGHYVSENSRRASSERWRGENNPIHNQMAEGKWGRAENGSFYCESPYEEAFAGELEGLGLDFIHQYCIPGTRKVVDFYIPSKNLVVELETRYSHDVCGFNDSIEWCEDLDRYQEFQELGYNVLVFNPKLDTCSYRHYINKADRIVSIELIPYDGNVYDVEVSVDDSTDRRDMNLKHSFYANGILTKNCCRLRLDLRELTRRGGGLFGANDSTGSIGVVTVNLPRMAFLAKKEYPDDLKLAKAKFYEMLSEYMDLAEESLELKRDFVQKNVLEAGLIPAYKEYVGTLDNHFSTIGLVGMNEMCMNLLGVGIIDKEGKDFSLEVLDFMREKLSDYQEQTGHLYNLEATPAESTAYRLALKDTKDFGDAIYTQYNGDPYYTNSCHIPVKDIKDLKQIFDHQDELQCKFTGGTVVHLYLDGPINGEQAKSIVKSICTNYKLPYISLSPLTTTCPEHGLLYENVEYCPKCGKKTRQYQRITGYIREISNYNKGKAAEYRDRAQLKTKGGLVNTITEAND